MKQRSKTAWITCILIGYVAGTIIGYNRLRNEPITRYYCVESVGPRTCQPDEDCDRECLKWEPKLETREREAFYTYGLLGAFIGGWVSVFVITYLLKE